MAAMLDPDIQRLLDTVFNVPVGAEAPDVAQLRATAEAVPVRLGGEPEPVASITDAFAPREHDPLPVRVYRPAAAELLQETRDGRHGTRAIEPKDLLIALYSGSPDQVWQALKIGLNE